MKSQESLKMIRKSLVLLNRLKPISWQRLESIAVYFQNIDEIFNANRGDFLDAGFSKSEAERILSLRKSREIDDELSLITKRKIKAVDLFDQDYPFFLKESYYPPLVLYIKGDKKCLNEFCFAIVGSRLASLYGIAMADKFAYSLSSLGMVVVSGLARGIDTAAHKAALKGGKTVAVLGSGLLNIYPRENMPLAEAIAENGAVVSEFSPQAAPLRENFPRRNRIISGLSKGVLIVEAAAKSGALITARYALEQNREVFALPGKADSPTSMGTHSLIKEGAKLVDCLSDILDEFNIPWRKIEEKINLTADEKKVFDIINSQGVFLEEIAVNSRLERSLINRIVLGLQIKGFIKEIKPLCFARVI
ncbi:MAG: DNA-processing protein DprA [Candidatus Omnitrophota bacterium]